MSEQARKRGRPRRLDREAGLEIAARLFWERGYEGTSIADLTRAMEVTPPSLYSTFGSKDDLFRQAIDHHIARTMDRRSAALNGKMSAYEAFAFYLHETAQAVSNPDTPRGCMISNAILHHADENGEAAETVAARRAASIQAMKTRFDRAIADGEITADTDTESLARFYAAVVQGMAAQACDGAETEALKKMADIALQAWPRPAIRQERR